MGKIWVNRPLEMDQGLGSRSSKPGDAASAVKEFEDNRYERELEFEYREISRLAKEQERAEKRATR